MKRIQLTQGKEALVDDCDYEYLMQWNWSCSGNKHYSCPACWIPGRKYVKMSRLVAERMGLDISRGIDHEDRNPFNNQRYNLRPATKAQNGRNRGLNLNNTSGFKGVNRMRNFWQSGIKVNRKRVHLGTFDTPEEAAHAYDEAALKYFGEFAYLNFPQGT